jgi:dipeptidyl aminopeptidase/acylaminoacyl peptidase
MMRTYLMSLVLAGLCCGAEALASRAEHGDLISDNIPDAPASLTGALDAYLESREATPLGWGHDGALLIATRFGNVDQLHLVERPGAARRQLTFWPEPITRAAFSPDPNRGGFVYFKDVGGDENAQLFYQRLGEPGVKMLTDGKSSNGAAVWSNSGREVAFFSTARDGVDYDIDVVEPDSGTLPHLVFSADGAGWYPLDWSPNDLKLLVLKHVSPAEAYLYVVDLSTGQKREVEPSPGKVSIAGAKFSRDGQGVYLISDRDSEFAQLRYVNLFTGEKTVISGHIPWDIEELAISRDGHYLAFVSNEGGASKLNLVDLRAHQDLTPPTLPAAGVIGHLCFDADGKRLAFGFATTNRPRDAYVLDVESNRVEPWTMSETGPVDAAKFVSPRSVRFATFDSSEGRPRQIPMYVYQPASAGSHPVLIALHGSSQSQFRPGFDPWIQYLVNELGFAVVVPNVRGSSGYGKSYRSLGGGVLREDAVKDLGALLVWLAGQAAFDAKHVVVSGDDYGGYLALAALVNYSERLQGGVDFAGITDFVALLSNAAPGGQNQRRAVFGDERDPDMRAYLRRISPLTNADRITRPVLIVHGKNDPRVPISQAEQLVNTLRSRGGEVWFLQAVDEGHAFRKKQNRDAYYRAFAQFLSMRR